MSIRVALSLLLLVMLAFSQTGATRALHPVMKNAWQKIAMPLPRQADVSSADLDARGRSIDEMIGSSYPLDAPGRDSGGVGFAFDRLPQDEMPVLKPGQALVVGRFESFQPFLTPSHRSIYTQMRISVERTVIRAAKQPAGADTIDVLVPGGTVRLDDGRVLSYAVTPDPDALIPHQEYVLALSYRPDGNFYVLSKSWLVRDGAVWPNTLDDATREQQGIRSIAGIGLKDFLYRMLTVNPGR